jgi:hypothetical protein
MVGQSKSSDALVWLGAAGRVSLEPPVNQPLTRLVKEVLAGALAVAVGVGEGGGDCEGGGNDCAGGGGWGGCGGKVDDVTVPAVSAGGATGGDSGPVSPVSDGSRWPSARSCQQ